MNDVVELITSTAERLFRDRPASGDGWESATWARLEELGMIHAGLPEALGGSGLARSDAAAIVALAAYHNVAAPLAETIAAGWLLANAGVAPPSGPLTLAAQGDVGIATSGSGIRLDGILSNVPWLEEAGEVIVTGRREGAPLLVRLRRPHDGFGARRNLAGEPRTSIRLAGLVVEKADVLPLPAQGANADASCLLAVLRALQMSGAMRRAIEIAIDYANVRTQFGRPLSKFQAIQQNIAMATGHYASALSIARSAAVTLDLAAPDPDLQLLAIGSAKSVGGEAATLVAAVVHQVMGAIGFTQEHDLHLSTRRLWAWRDEGGGEAYWNERIGRIAMQQGAEGFWSLLTQVGLAPAGGE